MSRGPEPASNVVLMCAEHASKPDPKWHGWPLANYVGRHVKRSFPIAGRAGNEHMWVRVKFVTPEGQLTGILDNDPQFEVGVLCGDMVTFDVTDIEDVIVSKER